MRCITIAKAIRELGEKATFFFADQESLRLYQNNASSDEFDVVVLDSDWRDMDGEADKLKTELRNRNIQTLLVDSYSVTRDYFEKLRSVCRIAYMDDLHKDEYPVNFLINYSGYSNEMGYEEAYKELKGFNDEKTRLCLGLQYAPLREQFYKLVIDTDNEKYFEDKNRLHVLVSTGGADMCGMLLPILDMLENSPLGSRALWHIVVGDYVDNPDEIIGRAEANPNVVVHRSVRNMAYLMKNSNAAVMAGGTMLTECAACGLPTVFYQVADNQKYNVQYWGKTEGMVFAGDVSKETAKPGVIGVIEQSLMDWLDEPQKLLTMSHNLQGITDGKGAIRIAKALIGEV